MATKKAVQQVTKAAAKKMERPMAEVDAARKAARIATEKAEAAERRLARATARYEKDLAAVTAALQLARQQANVKEVPPGLFHDDRRADFRDLATARSVLVRWGQPIMAAVGRELGGESEAHLTAVYRAALGALDEVLLREVGQEPKVTALPDAPALALAALLAPLGAVPGTLDVTTGEFVADAPKSEGA